MDMLTTETFRITTPAGPETVWRMLTTPELTRRWFHGLILESRWQAGSPVAATGTGGRLTGEVLAVAEPRRLSFTLAAGDDQPETFVTWEIHDAGTAPGDGSIVRLYVDEDADGQTESAWLPVISNLHALLAAAPATTSGEAATSR
jgi:uncharacterized protein YndB with AHSA1/START domain